MRIEFSADFVFDGLAEIAPGDSGEIAKCAFENPNNEVD